MYINKGGRPKVEIEESLFENLCAIQCTKNEICDVLGGIDEKTLTRWCKDTYGEGFSDVYKKKSAKGKASLRRTQFRLAEHNAGMAIFLGKQYLGQKDIVITESEAENKVDELIKELQNNARRK